MVTEAVAYMVAWTYLGVRRLVDFDSESTVNAFTLLLAEAPGREDIQVSRVPYQRDPEMAKRVWKRLAERIATEGVEMAVFG